MDNKEKGLMLVRSVIKAMEDCHGRADISPCYELIKICEKVFESGPEWTPSHWLQVEASIDRPATYTYDSGDKGKYDRVFDAICRFTEFMDTEYWGYVLPGSDAYMNREFKEDNNI